MIVGVGIDIIDVRRIKKILSKYGKKFKKRCFLSAEIKKTESKFHVINSYAKIYAAKEACSKALGTGFARGIHWKDIEVNDNIYGKPLINLHNNALKRINKIIKKNYLIELSISDEKNYAIANVVISKL